jgi:hypothetical protein
MFLVTCITMLGSGQSIWVETTQSDFADGTYERNLYASDLNGGAIEFVPRYDLNNDGYIDLFTADRYGPYVRIYWGSAAGYSAGNVTLFPSSGGGNCDAADLNGDGFADFLVSHYFEKLSIYWGSSTGPDPLNHQDFPMVAWDRQGVYIADFDKDGYLDITTTEEFIPYYGAVLWGSATGYSLNNRTDLPCNFGIHNIEVADFDKDNWLDILFIEYIGDYQGHILIYWGSSTGFLPSNVTTLLGPEGNTGVSIADLNADGYLDIVGTGWYDTESYLYWGAASGYTQSNMQILNPGYCYGGSAVADINDDSYLDIVYHRGGYGTNYQRIYWGSASGYSNSNFSTFGIPLETTGGLIADLNSDGYLDIFTNTRTPETSSYVFFGPLFTTYTSLPVDQDHHGMFREIGNAYNREYGEEYISSIFDAGMIANWGIVTWDDSLPFGASIAFYVRSGNTPSYDSTWSGWCQLNEGNSVPDSLNARYLQYMTMLLYVNPIFVPCLYDVSIGYTTEGITVTTPNGGECWIRGNSYDITWASYGVSGNVQIELYKGGSYYSTIVDNTVNDGSYTWNIPSGQLPGVDYQIRISSISNPAFFDFSDSDFNICSQIVVTAPNGGETWQIGETYDITWAPSGIGGNVLIEYSTNSGSSWTVIDSTASDVGSYSWVIPNTPTTEGRVKITHLSCPDDYDESDGDFTIILYGIIVASPNGGESWIRGNMYNITWASSGVSGNVKIELYKASSYNSTIADSVSNTGSYTWNVPSSQVPGTDYQIKITSVIDTTVFDFSDDDFVICSQIVVTAPNGGEIWYVGDNYDITWAPSGIGGDVLIEYSTNSGSTWLVLVTATPDNGSYTWTIPNTPTTHGRAKITHLACTSNFDESDGDFTITYSSVAEDINKLGTPSVFCLYQNQPNPFSGSTAIQYAVPEPCRVHIEVYDVVGKEIAALVDGDLLPGYYQMIVDVDNLAGRKLANGVYFYRMVADDYIETKTMTVLH